MMRMVERTEKQMPTWLLLEVPAESFDICLDKCISG